jgi:hypothetical protein
MREYGVFNGEKDIIKRDNRGKFCELFAGGERWWNKHFCFETRAIETRELMIKLAEFGENYQSLCEQLEVSMGTLSKAAGGTAGKKSVNGGESTTDHILNGLRRIANDYQVPDHNVINNCE